MFETAADELDKIKAKRDTIEQDKIKIYQVIEELEKKKIEAINKTHEKVNADLNEIVAEVLPNAEASLRAQEGKEIFEGLELAVSFSGVQKGLHELSGGQRSLIALALVLALLKFKPAPLYILDEIDAAMDLNYTQNIGRMLRKSFMSAQFIIVSLKEGMWSNANVVFRTSFRDSNSYIERTVNRPK